MTNTAGKVAAATTTTVLLGNVLRQWLSTEKEEHERVRILDKEWHSPGALVQWAGEEVAEKKKKLIAEAKALGLRVKELDSLATEHTIVLSADDQLLLEAAEHSGLKKCLGANLEDPGGFRELSRDSLEHFEGSDDAENFFTSAEKGRLLMWLLEEAGGTWHTKHDGTLDLKALQDSGAIKHVVLLHEEKPRTHLVNHWAKMTDKSWMERCLGAADQPLDDIVAYFGSQITLYFAFLGSFTKALVLPSVMGIVLMLYDWYFDDGDGDSPLTTLYAALLLLWSVSFTENWKREQARLTYRWGTYNFEAIEEVRPEFEGQERPSPISGLPELYYPDYKRWLLYAITVPVTLLCMAFVGAVMFFFLELCDLWAGQNIIIANIPTVGYSVSILLLNMGYKQLAFKLTEFENHKTMSGFQNALIIKLVVFEFFNYNCSLFHIAFYKQDLAYLRYQIMMLLVVFQVVYQILETVVPSVMAEMAVGRRLEALKEKFGAKAQLNTEDLEIEMEAYSAFDDYLEIMMQYGFVTLFAAAFPLAPLCALINNVTEIRADAFKLCDNCARPTPKPAGSLGAWLWVLQAMTIMGVFTNFAIIIFTSKQVDLLYPGLSSTAKLLLFVLAEQAVLLGIWFIEAIIPDIPEDVENDIARREYQALDRAKKALKSEVENKLKEKKGK